MKYLAMDLKVKANGRSALRGAWIEIIEAQDVVPIEFVAPPCAERGLKFAVQETQLQLIGRSALRGAWIEISSSRCCIVYLPGRSALRGAWIEISMLISHHSNFHVAPPCA